VEVSEQERDLRNRLMEVMEQDTWEIIPSLKSCDRKILRPLVDKINEAVSLIPKANVTETNDLLCATAYITTEMLEKIPMKKTEQTERALLEKN